MCAAVLLFHFSPAPWHPTHAARRAAISLLTLPDTGYRGLCVLPKTWHDSSPDANALQALAAWDELQDQS
eukprot:5781489-Amphidinium_carterae.2